MYRHLLSVVFILGFFTHFALSQCAPVSSIDLDFSMSTTNNSFIFSGFNQCAYTEEQLLEISQIEECLNA